MNFAFEEHLDTLALTPCLVICRGECEGGGAPAVIQLQLTFLFWTASVVFDIQHHDHP